MDWKIEVVIVPVSDVDRAKRFYHEQCGFNVDVDRTFSPEFRIVQLTPPGSACSITLGPRMAEPGSLKGIQICVADLAAARQQLASRGVDVSPIRHMENGEWQDGKGDAWNSFLFFSDPDGNAWTVQESPA